MSGFIVKARDMRSMIVVYYTGKAGYAWQSRNRADAFVYATEGEAQRKARMFQRQHAGYVWMVDSVNPDDAHASGAAAMSRDACGE